MTVAERVKWLRIEGHGKKLSRREFAEPLGVSEGVIQNIEESRYKGGDSGIPKFAITAICKTYNVREQWLLTGEGPMSAEDPTVTARALIEQQVPEAPEYVKSILIAFSTMPYDAWVEFRNVIDAIQNKEGHP